MRKPKAQATSTVPGNPKAGTDLSIKLKQGGEHLAQVAAYTAKRMGIPYADGKVLWSFDPNSDSDKPSVTLPGTGDKYEVSDSLAVAFVKVPLCAYDAAMIKALDAEINYRVQSALVAIQCALIDNDPGYSRGERISAKRNLRQSAGFEPGTEALKAADGDDAKRLELFAACESHRTAIADKAYARFGHNPYGRMKRKAPDAASLSISPTFECEKGCYKDNKAFEGERLPSVRNVPFVNVRTGKFTATHIKAVAKSPRLKCQHCGGQCQFETRTGTGTEAIIEAAKDKFQRLQDKVNGIRRAPAKATPNKVTAHEARTTVKLAQAEYYNNK